MSFQRIVGHQRAVGILRRALAAGRLAHSYLFVGPKGVGKRTVAWELARAIQCTSATDDACDRCRGCRKVEAMAHPDVVLVEAEGNQILVGQIRELQRQMMYRPMEGSHRVVIIDQAHELNPQAANALLKILEEPPEGNVLVLVARSEASLLPTIVSRCQRLQFGPLGVDQVCTYLTERAGWEASRAMEVASQAQGSIGRALLLRDEPVELWRQEAQAVLSQASGLGGWELLERARSWAGSRQEAGARLEALRSVIRDQMVFGVNQGRAGMGPTAASSRRWQQGLLRIWAMAGQAMDGLERNLNPQLLMEDLMVRISQELMQAKETGKSSRAKKEG